MSEAFWLQKPHTAWSQLEMMQAEAERTLLDSEPRGLRGKVWQVALGISDLVPTLHLMWGAGG